MCLHACETVFILGDLTTGYLLVLSHWFIFYFYNPAQLITCPTQEDKELLPVEQKGNAMYISLHTSQPMSNRV